MHTVLWCQRHPSLARLSHWPRASLGLPIMALSAERQAPGSNWRCTWRRGEKGYVLTLTMLMGGRYPPTN